MSNSIYRLLARWIYSVVHPILCPFLSKHQYGGLRGRSPGMATAQLLHSALMNPGSNCCLFLDLYHAFDTPPKEAILILLSKRGLPPGILLLLQSIFREGSTVLLGPSEKAFKTSCGIKQGCPLSCLLFISYFQLFLDYLTTQRLPFTAFVDDVALLLPSSQITAALSNIHLFLASMGLVLNRSKSEILPLRPGDPIPHPPCPVVEYAMHLGHPLFSHLDETKTRALILQELQRTLRTFHDVPLPSLHRVRLVNVVILPTLLHRVECLWLPQPIQKTISKLLLAFCLGVTGLPPHMSPKTVHSTPPYGLGLHFFPQRYTTRTLDNLHKAHLHSPLQTRLLGELSMQPLRTFLNSVKQNLPTNPILTSIPTNPPPTFVQKSIHGIVCFEAPHPPPPLPSGHAFSDGSYFAHSCRAGAAAVSPGGTAILARTPGMQGIYPSELLGAFLASKSSAPCTLICLDNQGAVKALSSNKAVVRHSHLVTLTRASIRERNQKVKWIKGHADSRGNQMADTFARQASSLPPQPPAQPQSMWDVIVDGLHQLPPHKCWTERQIPTHRHAGIHTISFAPLKRCPDSTLWIKWLFGLCWRPGWDSYHSFWIQTPSRHSCPFCRTFHNASINGALAFCDAHPLRKAWLEAWNGHPLVIQWAQHLSRSDCILVGKVCIPASLYRALSTQLGRKATRNLVFAFQRSILPLLQQCLDSLSPLPPQLPKGKRKRIWTEDDWNDQGQELPINEPQSRQQCPRQPLISTFLRVPSASLTTLAP